MLLTVLAALALGLLIAVVLVVILLAVGCWAIRKQTPESPSDAVQILQEGGRDQ